MNTNEIFNQMFSGYDITTEQQMRNAIFHDTMFHFANPLCWKDACFGNRAWKNRVKGRDWYDFEWYVRHNVPLDFTHLCERALQFNQEELDKDTFLQKLNERLATADLNQVKADVLPFVRNPKELDIWSNDYFMELAKMIRFE